MEEWGTGLAFGEDALQSKPTKLEALFRRAGTAGGDGGCMNGKAPRPDGAGRA